MPKNVWSMMLLVAIAWAALYLPYLGSREIHGEEARRILPARTMLQNGDWVVPQIGGMEYSRKPPLINWCIAGSFVVTGEQTEFSSRLPSVLWLLAFALIATWALTPKLGTWRAACVPLFMLTTLAILDKGRMAEIEAMYVAQTGIALVLWVRWWLNGKTWLAYTVPWIMLGVGLLAKGPVHLIFFYPIVLAALHRLKRWRELYHPAHIIGVILMIGVFAPWAWLNLNQVSNADESSGVWTQQLLARIDFGNADFGRWALRPFQILIDFLPWTPLLIWGWLTTRKELKEADRDDRWVAILQGCKFATVAGYAILLLSPEGLPRYAQPLYPALALLLVDLLGRVDSQKLSRFEGWWKIGNLVLPTIGVVAAPVALLLLPKLGYPISIPQIGLALGVGVIALGVLLRLPSLPLLAASCLSLAAASIIAHALLMPAARTRDEYTTIAAELKSAAADEDGLIVFLNPDHLRFLFYIDRPYQEVKLSADLPHDFRYLVTIPRELKKRTVQKRIDGAVELGRYEWEGRDYVVFDLKPN